MNKIRIGLLGNPNCGKTTLFNLLTGSRQHVGNWPGVTVERKEGSFTYSGYEFLLIDLPGTYSLVPASLEEKIARDYIINNNVDLILNVVDGTTLERSMVLTTQLLETEIPFIVLINMMDEVIEHGIQINMQKMEGFLKAPVIGISAKKSEGIVPLIKKIIDRSENKPDAKAFVNYGEDIEEAIGEIQCSITPVDCLPGRYPLRWLSIRILEQDKDIQEMLANSGVYSDDWKMLEQRHTRKLYELNREDTDVILAEKRFGFIKGIIRECVAVKKPPLSRIDLTESIDTIVLNKYFSYPVFALILWGTFQLTFLLGGFFSNILGAGVHLLGNLAATLMPQGILKDLVIEAVISGVGGILVFLPQIMILFLIIAILEDSGYMARVAFIMDRLMHFLGVHGKSFISLFMGIGCNVPGIMAARMLENEDDRKVTVLINPFMSCSARLPIYVLITGMFFSRSAGSVIFFLYILGILAAIVTAKILKTFVFRGVSAPFVMELPPYRTPSVKSLMVHMWERASLFLRKMGGVILAGSIIIWVLGYFPRISGFSGHIEGLETSALEASNPALRISILKEIEMQKSQEQIENSYIGRLGMFIEPFFKPLGFGWKEGVALITGVVGKEIVVSTLSVLYGTGKDDRSVLKGKMESGGMTGPSALAFLVFVLLYIPCLAAISAVRRETNSVPWTLFSIFYGIGVGYLVGLAVKTVFSIIIA